MAFYHVGGCDCPSGCCDCRPSKPPRAKTDEELNAEVRYVYYCYNPTYAHIFDDEIRGFRNKEDPYYHHKSWKFIYLGEL